jgi:hypothetical protein
MLSLKEQSAMFILLKVRKKLMGNCKINLRNLKNL